MRWIPFWLVLIVGGLPNGPASGQTLEVRAGDLSQSPIPGVYTFAQGVPDHQAPAWADDRIRGSGLLASLVARGQSAGLGGLLYENRDRGHSTLAPDIFPGLARLTYEEPLRKRGLDVGLASRTIVAPPLVGNASMAMTHGLFWRSLPRLAMTTESGPAIAHAQYAANSLYLYPEHRDHDDRDLYPANWPYTVISQGSSGSDQPFLRSLLLTLAAFPEDTRAVLERNGQIASTLTMILRRTMAGVVSDSDYMSGKAHPSVFDGDRLRPEAMISMAAAMSPDAVPPVIAIAVDQEDFRGEGDVTGRSDVLFTTPAAIARIWRDASWQHQMVVSAASFSDHAGRALTFHWVLLRGDTERVQIEPLDANGTRARLTVNWHEDYPAPSVRSHPERLTSRVDIGVFADNGISLSAPAFVSIAFPTHQQRQYDTAADGTMRLRSIDHDAAGRGSPFDPQLFWTGPWRDEMQYDETGRLTGWLRHQGGEITAFDSEGRLRDGRTVRYAPADPALPMVYGWQAN